MIFFCVRIIYYFRSPAIATGCQAEINGSGGKMQFLSVNSNQTIDGFWYSCEMDDIRIKYSRGKLLW